MINGIQKHTLTVKVNISGTGMTVTLVEVNTSVHVAVIKGGSNARRKSVQSSI